MLEINSFSQELQNKINDFIKDISEMCKKYNFSNTDDIYNRALLLFIHRGDPRDMDNLIGSKYSFVDVLGRYGHFVKVADIINKYEESERNKIKTFLLADCDSEEQLMEINNARN